MGARATELGRPWNKLEVDRFFRNYPLCMKAKDWTPLSRSMQGRTPAMLRAIYDIFNDYLSSSKSKSPKGLLQLITVYMDPSQAHVTATEDGPTDAGGRKRRDSRTPKRFQQEDAPDPNASPPKSKGKAARSKSAASKSSPSKGSGMTSHDSDLAILSLLALSNSGGKSAGSPTQMAAASPQGGGPDSPGFPPRQLFNAGKGNGKRKRQDLASQGVAPSVSSPLSARKRPKADGTGGTPARTPGGRKTAKSLKFAPVAPPPPPDMTKMAQWKAMTEQFLHLAKLPKARQWCKFEHFYSSIDTAILKDPDQFQQLMRTHFPKISEIEQMTEFEWFYIRKKMQLKPRRFSRAFVHSELEKLERTRGHVRLLQHRVQPPENSGVELPPQIPQAYTIAKRVLARFPDKQGAVLPGTVYGVQATKATYRIEFDDPALGMQTVPDYDVIGTEPDVTISTETLMKERIVMPSAGISDQPAHKITPSIQALEKNRSAGTHQDQQVMSTGLLTTAFNTADGLATTDALITKIIVMANRYISISVKSTDPNVLQDTQPILLEIISRMLLVKKKLLASQDVLHDKAQHYAATATPFDDGFLRQHRFLASCLGMLSVALAKCFAEYTSLQRRLKTDTPLVSVDDQFAAIRSICIQQSAKLNTSVGKGTLQAYFAMGVLAIRECARRGLGVTCSKKILNLIMKDCPVHEVKNKPLVEDVQLQISTLCTTVLESGPTPQQ